MGGGQSRLRRPLFLYTTRVARMAVDLGVRCSPPAGGQRGPCFLPRRFVGAYSHLHGACAERLRLGRARRADQERRAGGPSHAARRLVDGVSRPSRFKAMRSPHSYASRLWLVAACAVLLALRKPWALHTPQLWA